MSFNSEVPGFRSQQPALTAAQQPPATTTSGPSMEELIIRQFNPAGRRPSGTHPDQSTVLSTTNPSRKNQRVW